MAYGGRAAGGLTQSLRGLSARTPLRTKMITAVLGLVAVALAVTSVAGIGLLRGYLLSGVDQTLAAQQVEVEHAIHEGGGLNPGGPPSSFAVGQAVAWVPDGGTPVYVVAPVQSFGINTGNVQAEPLPAIPADTASIPTDPGSAITVGAVSGGARWRIVGIRTTLPQTDMTGTVVVATDASSVYRTIRGLTLIDLLVSLGVIALLAAIAAALIRASLRPLAEIEQTAGAIAGGDLSQRVPEGDPRTEVGRLGRSLNVMLSHIETAFRARTMSETAARRSEARMRQFVADASHELRTPLTAIRGFAEYYRQRGGVDTGQDSSGQLAKPDMDRIMRRVEQESTRMGVLVEDMLLLARLDQQRPLDARPVDLLTLAADAVHDARVVAPERSIHLTVSSGAALIVTGDEVRLRQVIGNLMTNALTHTPAGTPVDVRIRPGSLHEVPPAGWLASAPPPPGSDRPAAVLEVADQGPGLSAEQAEHVFERFYRADAARTTGGSGLGLAIVAGLVAAHGGATWVATAPGEGATFCIALPLTPEAAQGPDDDEQLAGPDFSYDYGPADGNGAGLNGADQAPPPAGDWAPEHMDTGRQDTGHQASDIR